MPILESYKQKPLNNTGFKSS